MPALRRNRSPEIPRLASAAPATALVLAMALLALPAQAVDGVVEISQACAVQTGCFSGDAAGLPVTIDGSAGGSYRLTSNLVLPDTTTDGIVVSGPSISIDLNGFEIVSAGCVGASSNCTPTQGLGSAIKRANNDVYGMSVRNGKITGMGSWAVLAGIQAEVADVQVRWNRFGGIFVDTSSLVSRCGAYQNGGTGIEAGVASTVSGSRSYGNGAIGIYVFDGSMIEGNNVRLNGSYGLSLASDAAYRDNVVTNNASGSVTGGLNLGGNACNGTTTCP